LPPRWLLVGGVLWLVLVGPYLSFVESRRADQLLVGHLSSTARVDVLVVGWCVPLAATLVWGVMLGVARRWRWVAPCALLGVAVMGFWLGLGGAWTSFNPQDLYGAEMVAVTLVVAFGLVMCVGAAAGGLMRWVTQRPGGNAGRGHDPRATGNPSLT